VKLSDIATDDFDAIFYVGGDGPLWDLAENADSAALIAAMIVTGKPAAAACHALGVLRHVKTSAGISVLKVRNIASFGNGEEKTAELAGELPFLVEHTLKTRRSLHSDVRLKALHRGSWFADHGTEPCVVGSRC